MGETLLPSIATAAAFLSVAGLLFIAFNTTLQTAQQIDQPGPVDPGASVDFRNENDFFYTPKPQVVTPADVLDDWQAWGVDRSPIVTFVNTMPHKHNIKFYVINNWTDWDPDGINHLPRPRPAHYKALGQIISEDDFLFFKMTWGVGNLNSIYAGVPYSLLEEKYDPQEQYATAWIMLNSGYNVFVDTGTGNFTQKLRSNDFNVSIGYPLNQSIDDVSPWTTIGQILTFSLPGTDTVVDFLIAVPFYLIIGFVILMIASRFIPTVGGG